MLKDLLDSTWAKDRGPVAVALILTVCIVLAQSWRNQQHVERLEEEHTQQITTLVVKINANMSKSEVRETLRQIRRSRGG